MLKRGRRFCRAHRTQFIQILLLDCADIAAADDMTSEPSRDIPKRPPEAPLLDDLAAIGVHLQSIWSTTHIKAMPPEAFRIMLRHLLSGDHTLRTREGIAAAIGRREGRDVVWDDLLACYRALPEDVKPGTLKERVGAALSEMAHRKDVPLLSDLLCDSRVGRTRIFFIRNLTRSRDPAAWTLLERLRGDPDLEKEIEHVLHQKVRRARGRVPPTKAVTH